MWMLAGLVLGVIACATPPEFACVGNSDCFLASIPGICTQGGHCAYPDDTCPSGFSFPVHTPGMGNACVPGDSATSGSGDDDDDDDDDDAAEATGSSDDAESTTGGDDESGGSGEGSDSGNTSPMTSATAGDSTTGAAACDDEVGDNPMSGQIVGGCEGGSGSQLVDESDVDWWAFIGPGAECSPNDYAAILQGPARGEVEICLMVGCEDGVPNVFCEEGEPADVGILSGCCSVSGEVAGALSCSGGTFDPFVSVTPVSSLSCLPYDFTIGVF